MTRWLRSDHDWKPAAKLRPRHFPATGRGLQCLEDVEAGQLIIRLPLSCLVTPSLVESDPVIGPTVKNNDYTSDCVKLASFLMAHWHRGPESTPPSVWKPYLDTIPETYDNPGFVFGADRSQIDVCSLPEPFKSLLTENFARISSDREAVSTILSLSNVPFVESRFLRAWFAVNTRCVSLDGTWALAPFLDLLNHSPTVRTTVVVDHQERCFKLVTEVPFRKYDQVFIHYGPHSNSKLWIEYGFFVPDNPFELIEFDEKQVTELLCRALDIKKSGSMYSSTSPINGPLTFYRGEGPSCAVFELVESFVRKVGGGRNDEKSSRLVELLIREIRMAKISSLNGQISVLESNARAFSGPIVFILREWVKILS
jgi:hypothetical protein